MSNEKNKAPEVETQNTLVEALGAQLSTAIEKMGEEMRKPTQAEARKQRQDELLEKRKAAGRRDEARVMQQERDRVVERCRAAGHAIHDSRSGTAHGFRGNLNSDGCIRPQCISCHVQLPPIKAPDAIKAGSSVNEWFTKLPWLTEAKLIQWSHETNPEYWAAEEKKAAERKEFSDAFKAESDMVGV